MSDILLAGDFYVGGGFHPTVDDAVCKVIRTAKHSLVNLEAPITDTRDPIEETGPHLAMPVSSLDHVKSLGFTALALANNRIFDAGRDGLAETLTLAHDRGFLTVGASTDKDGARSAAKARLPLSQGSLTVLNYCEHAWSVIEEGVGATEWDVLDAFSDIQEAKQAGDRVLVVLHGGKEYFPLPRPGLRKELRFLSDNGADAIVMHHTHVPAAYEVWNGVPIFYGLGNFQFTQPSNHRSWHEGLLLGLSFPKNAKSTFEIIPIRQDERFDLHLGSTIENEETINELEGYRLQVTSDDALSARWNEFADKAATTFAECVLPTSRLHPRTLRRFIEVSYARLFLGDLDAREAALNYSHSESQSDHLTSSLKARLL